MLSDMTSNPRGDNLYGSPELPEETAWTRVLAHREREQATAIEAVIERFRAAGVTPEDVESHLQDGGDRLYAAVASGRDGWSEEFGGERAVALLAAEVSALMSHLIARARRDGEVGLRRGAADEFSVTVAGALGVARQSL